MQVALLGRHNSRKGSDQVQLPSPCVQEAEKAHRQAEVQAKEKAEAEKKMHDEEAAEERRQHR